MEMATHIKKFSLINIKMATKNFSDQNKVGSGRFGIVYKGKFGERLVAVKRRTRSSISMSDEEIATLSHIQHLNIERLLGYCDEEGEKIVVYEFKTNHTLEYHLQDEHRSKLGWKDRLNILIGVARGLCHLDSCIPRALGSHSDLKSSDILIDKYFEAKVANFGSAKRGYLVQLYNHHDTIFIPTDVYSFGIMMFEVVSGRRVIDRSCNFVTWLFDKEAEDMLDRFLRGNISQSSLDIYWKVTKTCCREMSFPRLKMPEVLSLLETALFMSVPLSDLKLHDPAKPTMVGNHDQAQLCRPTVVGNHNQAQRGRPTVVGNHDQAQRDRSTVVGNHDQAQRGTKRTYQQAYSIL